MLLRLSVRRGNSTMRFGGAPQWGIVGGPDLTPTKAAAMLAGKRVIVLKHGYRVEDPIDAYLRVWSRICSFYDVAVFCLWPGSDWMLGFWRARQRAAKAGLLLGGALGTLAPASLDVEGHSLGCMVALESLNAGLRVRNCILAAPAVDNESIQIGERYADGVGRAQRLLVAYSKHDKVLREAYTLGVWDRALGLTGPQNPAACTLNVASVDCSETVTGHSQYKADPTFLSAWEGLFS